MTKTVSTSKKPRKQHSPEFRSEALKLAERIGVTAAARELSLYESQLYNQPVNSACMNHNSTT
ncbi:transposase, partial [Escherichia coli]|uniref:transposase n=1 Tax=Escherichia coli TaxID=562 RepID=UPI003D9AB101